VESIPTRLALDFEFAPDRNRLPDVISMHVLEHRSGQEIALWRDQLLTTTRPPFLGPNDLIIAYSAMAEAVCMQKLSWWERPNIICPFTELTALRQATLADPRIRRAGVQKKIWSARWHAPPASGRNDPCGISQIFWRPVARMLGVRPRGRGSSDLKRSASRLRRRQKCLL
jgi:hypothetical protein